MGRSLNMSQFDNVSVVKRANVYFDGKCVSHSLLLADGTKKTVGVILPSSLVFDTGSPEVMEGIGGSCRVRMKGESDWSSYSTGQSFEVPGNSSFEISCDEPYHYVCHFS
ncbi:MAG TPA: pyrimidine/purine nucleoside phosphorylase [Candidatus Propionivibrio aalborgensis]|nr:pyrimidine/purine nucleoside phosphorylase [Candidatus Propionivibrio aalborgensis]